MTPPEIVDPPAGDISVRLVRLGIEAGRVSSTTLRLATMFGTALARNIARLELRRRDLLTQEPRP